MDPENPKPNPDAPPPEVLLHGDLDLHIHEARRLPNMDVISEQLRRCFAPCTTTVKSLTSSSSSRRHHHHHPITSDPYVTVSVSSATVARTRVIPNSLSPQWEEHFSIPLAHSASHLLFHVKDNDTFGAQLIGTASVPTSALLSSSPIDRQWIPILDPGTGRPPKSDCALLVSLKFTPVDQNPIYCQLHGGVPNCYFEMRKGGMVKLYQDAHVRKGELPEVELEKGRVFEHGTCWEDICHAILEAHHLIYLVGWSIYDKVRLVREPTRPLPSAGELTLGELLKYKSQEGVRVCLLVWDDKTSHDRMGIKTVSYYVL